MPSQSKLVQWLLPGDGDWRRLAAVGGLSLAALAAACWVKNRLTNELPPGPFAWPLLGSIGTLSVTGERAYTQLLDELYSEYGDAATVYIGRQPTVWVLEPKAAQEALASPVFGNRVMTSFGLSCLTENYNSIFSTPTSERWRLQRKLAHSSLRLFAQGERLERQVADAFAAVAEDLASDQPRDPMPIVNDITYNLIGGMTLSIDFRQNRAEMEKLREAMEGFNSTLNAGMLADLLPPLQLLPLETNRRIRAYAQSLVDWAEAKCSERKAGFDPKREKADILDHLLQEQINAEKDGKGHLFQDVNLRQTLLDLFFSGSDSMSLAIYNMIRALCMFPEMQQKCYEEISGVFGKDGTPSCSQRHRLPYTDAFLHEVLRYWTVTPLIPRVSTEDTTLCGWKIRKGTTVMLSVGRCLSDESVFPNARQFDPGHFLNSDGSVSPYQRGFLPFGAGTRVCPGEVVAKKELFLLLLLLLQRFRFSWSGADEGGRGISDESTILMALPKRFLAVVQRR